MHIRYTTFLTWWKCYPGLAITSNGAKICLVPLIIYNSIIFGFKKKFKLSFFFSLKLLNIKKSNKGPTSKLYFKSLIIDESPETGIAKLINGHIWINQIHLIIYWKGFGLRATKWPIADFLPNHQVPFSDDVFEVTVGRSVSLNRAQGRQYKYWNQVQSNHFRLFFASPPLI